MVPLSSAAVATRAAILRITAADLPLEAADAGLSRVLRDHPPDRVIVDRQLCGGETVFLELPRNQVLACDVDLVFLGVAGERDDFHAIEQRGVNRPELVRRWR